MSRHHMTSKGPVPFTAEEEVARDAEEAALAAKQLQKNPALTKEQLMAEIAALTAKIQALE